ncbi:MAG: serine/threonine protein kinase [Thermoactinomyces sp.]
MRHGDVERELKLIRIVASPENELVAVKSVPPVFNVIGRGTDAIVVSHPEFPGVVFKVYANDRIDKKEKEWAVYQKLGDCPFFARCYGYGDHYLILSHEKGWTLYECLERGVAIPERVIHDVKAAMDYARRKGLNPRDIHLKNVLLQKGRAKLIDVSEYLETGQDHRWEHLVEAYYAYYPYIRGRKIPRWLMERVKKAYLHQREKTFSLPSFVQSMKQRIGIDWLKQEDNGKEQEDVSQSNR